MMRRHHHHHHHRRHHHRPTRRCRYPMGSRKRAQSCGLASPWAAEGASAVLRRRSRRLPQTRLHWERRLAMQRCFPIDRYSSQRDGVEWRQHRPRWPWLLLRQGARQRRPVPGRTPRSGSLSAPAAAQALSAARAGPVRNSRDPDCREIRRMVWESIMAHSPTSDRHSRMIPPRCEMRTRLPGVGFPTLTSRS